MTETTNKITHWYTSSTGEGVSRTFKGFAHGIIPLILIIGPSFGFNVTPDAWPALVDAIGVFITAAWGTVAAVMVVFGLARKIIIRRTK